MIIAGLQRCLWNCPAFKYSTCTHPTLVQMSKHKIWSQCLWPCLFTPEPQLNSCLTQSHVVWGINPRCIIISATCPYSMQPSSWRHCHIIVIQMSFSVILRSPVLCFTFVLHFSPPDIQFHHLFCSWFKTKIEMFIFHFTSFAWFFCLFSFICSKYFCTFIYCYQHIKNLDTCDGSSFNVWLKVHYIKLAQGLYSLFS